MLGYVNETNGTVEGLFQFTTALLRVYSRLHSVCELRERSIRKDPDVLGWSASIHI